MRIIFRLLSLIVLIVPLTAVSGEEGSPFESGTSESGTFESGKHGTIQRTSASTGARSVEHSLSPESEADAESKAAVSTTPDNATSKFELTGKLKPQVRSKTNPQGARSSTARSPMGQWMTTFLGLAIVLGLICSFAFAFRKHLPQATKILPPDVVEVLGRRFIDQRNCVQLIRCGNRILIVAHSPTHGLQTLGEIADPVEVDSLAGRCRQTDSSSMTSRFEELVAGQFRTPRDRAVSDSGQSLEDDVRPSPGLRLPRNPLSGSSRQEVPHA